MDDNSKESKNVLCCLNCNTQLDESANYCQSCGQKNTSLKEPVLSILNQWLATTFNIDGKIFKSFAWILFFPWRIINAYLSGQRKSFTHPVRLYIFSSVLFFIWISFDSSSNFEVHITDQEQNKNVTDTLNQISGLRAHFDSLSITQLNRIKQYNYVQTLNYIDSLSKLEKEKSLFKSENNYRFAKYLAFKFLTNSKLKGEEGLMTSLIQTFSKFNIVFAFFFSLILLCFFKSSHPFWSEHILVALFYFSHSFLWLLLLSILGSCSDLLSNIGDYFVLLLPISLYVIILKVYKRSKLKSMFQFIMISIASCITYFFLFILFLILGVTVF